MRQWIAASLAAGAVFFGTALGAGKEADHAKVMEGLRGQEDHVGAWERYPVAGIPLVETAPVIDGVVDTREWFAAARLGRFVDYHSGVATRDRTDMYLCYTATHLYMAFQIERPQNARKPAPNDFLEILFDTSHAHAKYYSVAAQLEKILWDGIGPNVDRDAWNPTWQYKARETSFGWEGEMAVSFKDFGLNVPPAAGTVWGADFIRNEKTPVDRLAVWAFRGKNWHAVKNFGHIVFTGRPVAFRVEEVSWMPGPRQAGVKLVVSNFGKEPAPVEAELTLRKAPKPPAMEYYTGIESAMAEDLPAAVGSPLRNEITRAIKDYDVVREMKKTVTVGPGESSFLQAVLPDEPGLYLAGFRLGEGARPIFAGMAPFRIAVPLAIKLESYLYSARTLAWSVDLRRVQEKMTPASTLLVTVRGADGKTVAETKVAGVLNQQDPSGTLHFDPPPDTTMMVEARIVDGDKVVAKNEEALRVPPKPVWLGNALGKKKFVPEPWTPVKAADRSCELAGVRYTWPEGALLPEFTTFGRQVMSGPMRFVFQGAEGKELALKITRFALREQDIEKATWAFAGTIGDAIEVAGEVAVEFDSFAWYRMTLTPRGAAELSAATLHFPVRKEYARVCTAGDNKYSGGIPPEGLKFPFIFSYWVGGTEGGIQWMAESNRGWSNVTEKDVARVEPTAEGATLSVRFVDKPVKLEKPVEWSFGIIPTPSRVKPKDWGKYAFYQAAGIVNIPQEPAKELQKENPNQYSKAVNAWRYFNGAQWKADQKLIYAFIYHGYWQELFGYPGTDDPKRQEALKKSVEWLHGLGIKVIVYAGWGMNNAAPEWKDYGTEMVRLPLYNSGYGTYRQCPTTLWQDWFVWKMAAMIRDYDIDGIFIDSVTSPFLTENYTPGMRWVDDAGKVRGSYPILASREWLKRLYKLWHGEMKPNGVVYNHNSPPAIMAIENFCDVRTPSEFAQTYEGVMDRKFMDFFIAKNGGEQYGLFVEFTNKDWMGAWARKKVNQLYAASLPLNVSVKSVNLFTPKHGSYDLDAQPMQEIWAASAWVDRSTAEYLPWWRNAEFIKVEPSDDMVLHALWLQKGKKALLCLSNLDPKPRTLTATLDFGKMGFKGATADDAITGAPVTVNGNVISLPVEAERYRLVRLTAQP
jgi:hypothetical protein